MSIYHIRPPRILEIHNHLHSNVVEIRHCLLNCRMRAHGISLRPDHHGSAVTVWSRYAIRVTNRLILSVTILPFGMRRNQEKYRNHWISVRLAVSWLSAYRIGVLGELSWATLDRIIIIRWKVHVLMMNLDFHLRSSKCQSQWQHF